MTRTRSSDDKMHGRKGAKRRSVQVDLEAILTIDHSCNGCGKDGPCCCATYEVCVTAAEMKRIIQVLPEAAKFCPHLGTDKGYDNVFDEVERGLFAIDTTEDGLCLLAYEAGNTVHCSLHTVALRQGLPLSAVKPKACILWPLTLSDGEEVLSLTEDALLFNCNTRRGRGRLRLSQAFTETIEMVYGDGCGNELEKAVGKGLQRAELSPRVKVV